MPCLVEIIEAINEKSVWDQLREAAGVIAIAYLDSRQRVSTDGLALADLFEAVNSDGEEVDLTAAHRKCRLVRPKPMDAGELRNNLRHIEVLLGVEPLLTDLQLTPARSAPTQNSRDERGTVVADLEAAAFAVEGFGGDNIRNNSKDANALDVLRLAKEKDPKRRAFFAARASALPKGWQADQPLRARHARERYVIEAEVIGRWTRGGYALLEVADIKRTIAARKEAHNGPWIEA